jgi:hypothetical protein
MMALFANLQLMELPVDLLLLNVDLLLPLHHLDLPEGCAKVEEEEI